MTTVDLTDMEITTPVPAAPIELNDVQALAIAGADHQIDVMLSAEEARQIVKNINGRFEQSRKDLIELEDREGWRALGYESWRACVMAEFTQSVATLYRQLEAAKIEREIFGVSQVETPTPTAQLQAVKHLPTEQKRAAFQRADQLAGDRPRTAAHVTQAAAEIAAPFWQSMSPNHPTAHLWTRTGVNEHHAACGMTTQRQPSGSTEAGHCSSCVRATWPQAAPVPAEAPDLPIDFSIVQRRLAAHGVTLSYKDGMFVTHTAGKSVGIATPTWSNVTSRLDHLESAPDPDPDAAAFRMTCPTCGETLTNGVWGDRKECGACYHARQRVQPAAPATPTITIAQLDQCMPASWGKLGYYWKSAQPITAAHNDGWTGEAPTIALAIALVADREKARNASEPITVFPALNAQECRALIREAQQFIERGIGRDYPTIGKALRIAARMALEATE